MYSLLKPFIFKVDPEMAHDLAIKSLKYNFLPEDIFKVPGHSVHGPTQASCKLKLIKAGRIYVDTPYWAGSIYKFNRAERELLRSAMPEDPTWMEDYSVPYRLEDEGKLSELAMCVMNDPIIIKYFKGFEEISNK